MTLAMTQPAPEFPEADVFSLEVDLAEVTAEVPVLRLDDVREASAMALVSRARPLSEAYLGLLRQAAQVLRADVSADETLRALFHDIRELMGVDAYFNFMVNGAGDALALASCSGVTDDEARAFERVEFGQAVCGNVALKRAPAVISGIQASNDRRVQMVKNLGIRAVACNPLIVGDRLLGTLSFASRTRDEFGAEELAFFGAIARAVALSHERARLVRELAAVESELDGVGRSTDAAPSNATVESAAPTVTAAASAAMLEAAPALVMEDVAAVAMEAAPAVLIEAPGVEVANLATIEAAPAVEVVAAASSIPTADVVPLASNEVPAAVEVATLATTDATSTAEAVAAASVIEAMPAAPEVVPVAAIADVVPLAPASVIEAAAAAPEVVPFAAMAEVAPVAPIEATPVAAEVVQLPSSDDGVPSAATEAPIELIEASPVGAEVISFARYVALLAAADVPLGLIEAAPVSALEVSPFAFVDDHATETEVSRAEPTANAEPASSPAIEAVDVDAAAAVAAVGAAEALSAEPVADAAIEAVGVDAAAAVSAVGAAEALSAEPVTDAAIEAVGVDATGAVAAIGALEAPSAAVAPAGDIEVLSAEPMAAVAPVSEHSPQPPIVEEAPRDEVLALALAATDAPTLEVLALALTVDDPPHHDDASREAKVESEITVELCALDLNTVRMPTLETPALDLSSNEISALDLRPVETIEIKALRETPRVPPKAGEIVDDEAPTVEVKALAIQELEAERAPIDEGEDITFTYVPPK